MKVVNGAFKCKVSKEPILFEHWMAKGLRSLSCQSTRLTDQSLLSLLLPLKPTEAISKSRHETIIRRRTYLHVVCLEVLSQDILPTEGAVLPANRLVALPVPFCHLDLTVKAAHRAEFARLLVRLCIAFRANVRAPVFNLSKW